MVGRLRSGAVSWTNGSRMDFNNKEARLKVGILGSGIVGRVLGAGFIQHGHDAMLGTRDQNKQEIKDWLRETPGARAGTFEEAARFGDMIVLAALGRAIENIIDLAGPANFDGKTVIDATNPLSDEPPVNGILQYTTGPNESLGERIQAKLPAAHVVKAFNSVGNALMINPQFPQGAPTMFTVAITNKPRRKSPESFASSDGSPTIVEPSLPPEPWSRSACCGAFPDFYAMIGSTRSRCSPGEFIGALDGEEITASCPSGAAPMLRFLQCAHSSACSSPRRPGRSAPARVPLPAPNGSRSPAVPRARSSTAPIRWRCATSTSAAHS